MCVRERGRERARERERERERGEGGEGGRAQASSVRDSESGSLRPGVYLTINLIAASGYDRYSLGPFIRPICTCGPVSP